MIDRRAIAVPAKRIPSVRQTLSDLQPWVRPLRTIAPYLLALSFTSVAQAQGTMDFSGAQTLMGTFNTIAFVQNQRATHDMSAASEDSTWQTYLP